MPLGPWAIAKRSLRIHIVFSSSPLHHLLDGVMDKLLTFNAEGPRFKSRGHLFFFIFLHQMKYVYHSEANFLNSSMPEQSFVSKNIQNQTFLSQRNLKTQGLETCDDLFRR